MINVYVLVYSLVSSTSTLNYKSYCIEDTYIHASLCEMVTYYTQFLCYYFELDIHFSDWFHSVQKKFCHLESV